MKRYSVLAGKMVDVPDQSTANSTINSAVDDAIQRVLKKPKTDAEFVTKIQLEVAEQAAKRGEKMSCVTKVKKRDAEGRIEEVEMIVTHL